jgi:hypothetical protein
MPNLHDEATWHGHSDNRKAAEDAKDRKAVTLDFNNPRILS